jgi:hypothetical protein
MAFATALATLSASPPSLAWAVAANSVQVWRWAVNLPLYGSLP